MIMTVHSFILSSFIHSFWWMKVYCSWFLFCSMANLSQVKFTTCPEGKCQLFQTRTFIIRKTYMKDHSDIWLHLIDAVAFQYMGKSSNRKQKNINWIRIILISSDFLSTSACQKLWQVTAELLLQLFLKLLVKQPCQLKSQILLIPLSLKHHLPQRFSMEAAIIYLCHRAGTHLEEPLSTCASSPIAPPASLLSPCCWKRVLGLRQYSAWPAVFSRS